MGGDGGQVDHLVAPHQFARFGPGEQQQVADQSTHPVVLAEHLRGDVGPRRGVRMRQRHLDGGPDVGDGAPQLVRGVGDEASLLCARRFEPVEQRIQGAGQPADLVVRGDGGDPPSSRVLVEGVDFAAKLLHRVQRAPDEQPREQHHQDDENRNTDPQRDLDQLRALFHLCQRRRHDDGDRSSAHARDHGVEAPVLSAPVGHEFGPTGRFSIGGRDRQERRPADQLGAGRHDPPVAVEDLHERRPRCRQRWHNGGHGHGVDRGDHRGSARPRLASHRALQGVAYGEHQHDAGQGKHRGHRHGGCRDDAGSHRPQSRH